MTVAHPEPPATAAGCGPSWWAGGLTLRERLPAPATESAAHDERVQRRLERWRTAHGMHVGGEFAWRLADDGLDEARLAGLLAERPEQLAARIARPAWADLVEQAVASATEHPDQAAAGFAAPLRPLVDAALAKITRRAGAKAAAAQVDLDALGTGFAAQLSDRLVRIAARTLVLELNVARVRGRLTEPTAQERFASFTRQLASGSGLGALFGEYPVLARLLGQACQYAVQARLELLNRFAADRTAIVRTLLGGTDPGQLTAVEVSGGDPHQRGRAVGLLRFASGATVVYKPRSLDLHSHFGELVQWLNSRVPTLGLRTVRSVARTGYGWLEFVAHQPCTVLAEVDRFYHRQGALLALLYALDGTDIHYENLIACADQPVLVDVETLFHPTLPPPAGAGSDPAAMALTASVHRAALLPQLLVGEHGALDISGLGGDDGGTFPTDVVGWEGTGTDQMRLVRRSVEFTGAANRPRLNGRDVEPGAYRAALLNGFRAGYDAIVAHREDLLGQDGRAGLLERCADDEIRVVPRDTRTYAILLDESTHPDVLRDALDRDRVLDLLWAESAGDPVRRRLVRHEISDLWAGDIPMFLGRPGSRHLWTSTAQELPDLLETSGLGAVRAKIATMGEVDRHDQEWLIMAALAARSSAEEHRSGAALPAPVTTAVPDPQRLLAAACGIADQLVARALHDDHRANWLGLERVEDRHWTVLPMGAGLAEGYCGVALFLAQLGRLTGVARYRDLARQAVRPIPWLVRTLGSEPELAAAVGSGAFLGLGGICYSLARLGTLLEDDIILRSLAATVDLAAVTLAGQTPLDGELITGVAAGHAGGLAAMLAVQSDTGLASAGRLATGYAERLAGLEPPTGLTPVGVSGFAHGPAGVGWALGRFAVTVEGGRRHAVASLAALEREPSLAELCPIRQSDRHTSQPTAAAGVDLSWCSGLAGVLLANADRLTASRDPQTSADLDRCVAMLADRAPLRDTSLCHGELGVVEALTVLASRGHQGAASASTRAAALVLGALDQYGPRCGTPDGVSSPGLLTGLAGIGYGLLRLGFADQVPSVLLLEPGTPSSPAGGVPATPADLTVGRTVTPLQKKEVR